MGLDMYLTKKTYVKRWEHQSEKEKFSVTVLRGGTVYDKINPERISGVEEEVGYWRKANQIHKWFVDNVQNGTDECQESYVPKEKLVELLETCKKIKDNPILARELLPTQSGFFFGDTQYNEWYFYDINETIKILEPIVKNDDDYGDYYYQASW